MKTKSLIFVLFLIACGQSSTDKEGVSKADSKTITEISVPKAEVDKKQLKTVVQLLDLQNKIFDIGDKSHFTDSCIFYFECDCCSGDLMFNSDLSFDYKAYCVADVSFTSGQYSITNDTVRLHFSGHSTTEAYNWNHEIDSNAVEYITSDTTFTPTTYNYRPEWCNGKLKLVNLEYEEIAIQTDKEYQSIIK